MLNSPDFYIEQIVSGRLSEFAYYIESGKEAVVIDPVREPDPYLSISSGRDATIKYIFLTHYHSDFVSGHLELARRTGAKIVFGPQANAYFDNYEAKDDEEFQFGNVKIKAIHTPGHTIESTCYLLSDSQKRPCYLFTGDTLYIGDVGRIDFAANFSGIPEKELAGKFYDSLWKKLRPLPGSIYICPAHGETSYAGYDTLANQKRIFSNIYAMGKEKFMESIINCSDKSPAYFTNCAKKNKFGYTSLEDLLEKGLRPILLEDFKKCRLEGCTILDTRDAANIQQGFIPGSTTISLKTNFEAWAGTLLDPRSRIILVTERGKEKESIIKLARIGFENVEGYLEGGYKTWTKARDPVQKYNTIAGGQLKDNMSKRTQVLDVRQESEWKEGVVEGSQLISLSELEKRIQELPKDKTIYVYCKLGGRSLIAYSILTKNGFQNVYDVKGGFESVKASGVQLVEPQLQKMKVKEMVSV